MHAKWKIISTFVNKKLEWSFVLYITCRLNNLFIHYIYTVIVGTLIFGSPERQVVGILIVNFPEHQQHNVDLQKRVLQRQWVLRPYDIYKFTTLPPKDYKNRLTKIPSNDAKNLLRPNITGMLIRRIIFYLLKSIKDLIWS